MFITALTSFAIGSSSKSCLSVQDVGRSNFLYAVNIPVIDNVLDNALRVQGPRKTMWKRYNLYGIGRSLSFWVVVYDFFHGSHIWYCILYPVGFT